MSTGQAATVEERVAARSADLSPAEAKVARFFADHREEVAFISSA